MSITIGLIGLGAIIPSHLAGMDANPRFRIIGVCDRHPDRRAHYAHQLDCPGYAHYGELIARGPDVVVVALPHGMHCEVVLQALKAGCHAVVEKPMALSVEECRQMLAAAQAKKRVLIVSETASFYPGPRCTGEKFAGGNLGRFLTGSIINARFYFHEERPAWFLDPAMSGGGMFSNVGLHRLAIARAALPGLTPIHVTASVSHLPPCEVEACTTAIVQYAGGGAMVYEEVGYHPPPDWLNLGMHFVFEEGIVGWDEKHWRLKRRTGEEVVEPLTPHVADYAPVYANLSRALLNEPYRPHARELAVDTAIVQAAYASAREGCRIDLRSEAWHLLDATATDSQGSPG